MNTNTIETNLNSQKVQLQDEVEQNQYINAKNISGFDDIKIKLLEILESFSAPKELSFDEQMNEKFLNLDFGSEFDVNADKIGVNDAIFFVNLLNQQNLINYTVENNQISLSDSCGKKIQATNSLLSMLETSINSNKPIRLDFDNNITVILKMDKEGKIQAHFIPATSEVEAYLKNNIPSLRQTFDDENIKYSQLSYSKYKNQENNSKKEKRGSK